jgi:CHASE2 domain-containing sensor protein
VLLGLAFLPSGLAPLSYDLNFRFRPNLPVGDVEIIYADLKSYEKAGRHPSLEWDRTLHADLIDKLREAGTEAIIFDMEFPAATNSSAADAANKRLAEAAGRFGKVAVAANVEPVYGLNRELIGTEVINKPFAELAKVTSWGLAGGPMAADKDYVRRYYSAGELQGIPSLPWRAAEITHTNLPAAPFAERLRWMNYCGPPGLFQPHSYWDVLNASSGEVSRMFSNKVVFVGKHLYVGMASGKEVDEHRTPYTRWTGKKSPGPEINATAYLNIVRRDWLERTSPAIDLLMVVCLGGALGFGLARLPTLPAVGAGIACGVAMAVLAYLVTWNTHVWFPWLIFCVVQVPVAVGWSVLNHTRRLTQEKRNLEKSVALASVGERIGAAQLGQGLGPARQRSSGDTPAATQGVDTLSVPDHVLVRRIGRGAYGDVHLAQDIFGNYHAVKIVHRRHFEEEGPFEREFYGLKRFTPISSGHPGLIQVLHVGKNERNQYIYYIMELADDAVTGRNVNTQTYVPKNLAGVLKQRQRLPLSECLDICMQISDALAYLHDQHLIHRDIKPANIVFVNGRPKLADIGLVTETAGEDHSVSFLGTEGYMPPEGPGTPQADIYSFGKMIYQAASGFPVSRFPELPTALMESGEDDSMNELNNIILVACETNPKKRYKSATELKEALSNLAQKSRSS